MNCGVLFEAMKKENKAKKRTSTKRNLRIEVNVQVNEDEGYIGQKKKKEKGQAEDTCSKNNENHLTSDNRQIR